MYKKVFIIIVTYNGEKWLQRLMESLYGSVYSVEILIVDNNSSDNSVDIIKTFPKAQLITSKENLGFGKANNIGIQEALKQHADYVFLLNQDTWVYPNTIGDLVKVAESNKIFGIISPVHLSNNEETLDKNFEVFWNRKTQAITDDIDEVPFVNAAAWLIPKEVIRNVGFFESMFLHYGEDRNYVNRVLYHQNKIVIAKSAKICHDRKIVRNYKKDVTQSKYKILNELLNVNNSLFMSYLKGFKSVFGLPKYFLKYYSAYQVGGLFFKLFLYYMRLKIDFFSILKKRASYK